LLNINNIFEEIIITYTKQLQKKSIWCKLTLQRKGYL